MSQEKRLDKIEGSLTPKQAVILWMEEVHQHPNLLEYVRFLRGQPESEAPLCQIPERLDNAIRREMKSQQPTTVEAEVRRAVKDTAFLVHLHNEVNVKYLRQEREWNALLIALNERYLRLLSDDAFRSSFKLTTSLVLHRETPYPLDSGTAAAVEAAIRNHVTTWGELEEEGTLETWLDHHLLANGARRLPDGCYDYRDEKPVPQVTSDNEQEVRPCFANDADFERFKSGEDYSRGLAGVTDAEYNAYYEGMVSDMEMLIKSGKVKAGSTAWLETVPVPFLREAPLTEGKWVDRHNLELAEWGALLVAAGYQAREEENGHPLASALFVDSGGNEVGQTRLQALRRKAIRNLKMFPGRTKKIDGRSYVHFEDYCGWAGRNVPGNLAEAVEGGFVTDSWNEWIGSRGGGSAATAGGIPTERLACYVKEYSYCASSNSTAEQEKRRRKIASRMERVGSRTPREVGLASVFRQTAVSLLTELCGFRGAVASISQQYFEGREVLFPDINRTLAEIIEGSENLVRRFNALEQEKDGQNSIDLENTHRAPAGVIAREKAYLVDTAKAEALEFVGERRAGLELMERHL